MTAVETRRCGHPGCDTALSQYNAGDYCSLHEGRKAEEQRTILVGNNVETAILGVLARSNMNLRKREIVERTGENEHTVSDALARLRTAGMVEKIGTSSASTYRLPDEDDEMTADDPVTEVRVSPDTAALLASNVEDEGGDEMNAEPTPEPAPQPSHNADYLADERPRVEDETKPNTPPWMPNDQAELLCAVYVETKERYLEILLDKLDALPATADRSIALLGDRIEATQEAIEWVVKGWLP